LGSFSKNNFLLRFFARLSVWSSMRFPVRAYRRRSPRRGGESGLPTNVGPEHHCKSASYKIRQTQQRKCDWLVPTSGAPAVIRKRDPKTNPKRASSMAGLAPLKTDCSKTRRAGDRLRSVFRPSTHRIHPLTERSIGVHSGHPSFRGVTLYFSQWIESLRFEDGQTAVRFRLGRRNPGLFTPCRHLLNPIPIRPVVMKALRKRYARTISS
jgi:hypothetical protein